MSLDDLAQFLNSDNAPQGCMDLSELDGFMAGLIAGPEPVARDEWLAEVWDNEEPDYIDDAEREAVEEAIFARYDAIESGLDATPLGYAAILWQDEDASMLLIPIASLAGMTLPEGERGGQAMTDDALDGLVDDAEQVLPVCVLGLRRFWRERSTAGGAARH